jgi:hypothetical protein
VLTDQTKHTTRQPNNQTTKLLNYSATKLLNYSATEVLNYSATEVLNYSATEVRIKLLSYLGNCQEDWNTQVDSDQKLPVNSNSQKRKNQ